MQRPVTTLGIFHPEYFGIFIRAIRNASLQIPRSAILFGLLLSIFQIFDGIMTAYGINLMGAEIEANVLIRSIMLVVGPFSALILTKLISLTLIVFVVIASTQVRWATKSLLLANVVYLCFAIIPWTYLLAMS